MTTSRSPGLTMPLFLHLLVGLITPTLHAGGRCEAGAEPRAELAVVPTSEDLMVLHIDPRRHYSLLQ